MNRFVEQHFDIFKTLQGLRMQLLDMLTDADLSYNPGGANLSLGGLCRSMGDIQQSYLGSLKTFKQDWSVRNTETGIEASVEKLKDWYQKMDVEINAHIESLSDADLEKMIDRGFQISVGSQLHVYTEAMFIFFGKTSIYIKALNKAESQQWQDWIG